MTAIHQMLSSLRRTTGTIYYFSATGSDAADGLTPATAKQTITAANALTLAAGDVIAFKGGDTFTGSLSPQRSSMSYTSYGGSRATINLTGTSGNAILVYNQSNITITDLILTGAGGGSTTASGLNVYCDTGTISGIFVQNVDATGFQHGFIAGGELSRTISGVSYINCVAYSNRITGFNTYHASANGNQSFLLSGCSAYSNGSYGFSLGLVQNAIMRRCLAYSNGASIATGAGIYVYQSSGCTVEYCESRANAASSGSGGTGMLFETQSSLTVQYCYTHGNNGSGFFVGNTSSGGSTGVVLRFCVSISDAVSTGNGGIKVSTFGTSQNTTGLAIYNNTVVQTNASRSCLRLEDLDPTGFIANNVFYATGTAVGKDGSGGSTLTTDTNAWFGTSSYGTGAITTDPLLAAPTSAPDLGIWNPATLTGIVPAAASPIINAGANLASLYSATLPAADFYGNAIGSLPTNLGAYDGPGT